MRCWGRWSDTLPEDGEGCFPFCLALISWPLEIDPDGEWISARTKETLLSSNVTDFSVVSREFLDWGAATEERPVVPVSYTHLTLPTTPYV